MNTNQTILVTGINGFVGQHLARELKAQGHTVIGTGTAARVNPSLAAVTDQYVGNCDLTKKDDVKKLPLKDIDAVVNLAGLSQMGASFVNKDAYIHTNVVVHTIIGELLLEINKEVRVVSVSSGAVYDPNQPMPLSETSRLNEQTSPYAQSKINMEKAMLDYRRQGLDVVIARPFNHVGPGQKGGFLIPDLAKGLKTEKVLTVGNLTTERDYTDVRDVAKAYVLLATQPNLKHGIYNVCSGHSTSGQKILELLKTALGKEKTEVVVDKSRFRPNDFQHHLGDNTRIKEDTGWQPSIPLAQTIKDFADWFKKD